MHGCGLFKCKINYRIENKRNYKIENERSNKKHKVQMVNTKRQLLFEIIMNRIIKWEKTFYYTGCQASTRHYMCVNLPFKRHRMRFKCFF
jgi:hypothetical protein